MSVEFPIIRIELERARQTLMVALSEQMLKMDYVVKAAIEREVTPEKVQAILQDQVRITLQAAIKDEVEQFYRYGKGRAALKKAIEETLSQDE